MTWPWDIPWNAEHDSLDYHFRKYGREIGAPTPDAYVRSAHETMRHGERFTFRRGPRTRVGYYHRRSRRFVVLTEREDRILSHSRKSENHVRQLPDSTFARR